MEFQSVNAPTSQESRQLAVKALTRLPLFQLSTAGMELFHTNMLYWLATERPEQSIAVWKLLGLPRIRVGDQSPFIRREWRHLDLVVWPGHDEPALVLENKIGAIPGPAQLDGYYASLRSARPPFPIDDAKFVLLTLTPPSFVLPEPWRPITYRDLLPALRETARTLPGPDATLVEGYAELVSRLCDLATAYDPTGNLNAPFGLMPGEWQMLNEARLLSLVEKVRAGRFAEIATKHLSEKLDDVRHVTVGYSNGSANYDWFLPGPAGRLFGWQLQQGQFRLAVILSKDDPGSAAEQVDLIEKHYLSYFDFSLPDELRHLLGQYRGRKPWLRFAPSFIYRGMPMAPETTWHDLLGLAVWFTCRAQEFVKAHQHYPPE